MLIPIATVSHTVFSKEYSSILYITRNKDSQIPISLYYIVKVSLQLP